LTTPQGSESLPPSRSPFTGVRKVRSVDEIVSQIEDAILSGRFNIGDRLPNERDLSQVFDVSRTTLREALRSLEGLGILAIRRGRAGGIYVARPSGDTAGSALEALIRFRKATMADLTEFRISFEGETAAFAARRAGPEDHERLGRIAAMAQAAGSRDAPWEEIAPIDIRFHEAVAQAAKNEVRVAVMLAIHRALKHAVVELGSLMHDELTQSVGGELAAIADAIREADDDRARQLMQHHIEHWWTEFSSRSEPAG
jgi:GntR family transcriptional repressor for pyruvate dehydrogenase complex